MSTLPDELRRIGSLAWPVAIGQLASLSMAAVDAIMVGHFDPTQMAVLTLANAWFFSISCVGIGILFSLDPLYSQAHGAGDRRALGEALRHGLALAMLLSLPVMAAQALAAPVLGYIGQPPELLPTVRVYCGVLALGTPATLAFVVVRLFLQAQGITRPATLVIIVANLANAAIDYTLIYGRFGFPSLGAAGAAIATSTCQYLMVGALIVLMRDQLDRDGLRGPVSWPRVMALLSGGVGLGLQLGSEVWGFNFALMMAGWLSAPDLAAFGVALNLASLSFMLPLGVSSATATRVGNLVGAGESWGKAAKAGLLLGTGVMTLSAVLFSAFPGVWARTYTDDAVVIALTISVLPIAGAFQLFDGIQVVCFGILRGAGDLKLPVLANLVGFWVLGLPLGGWLAFSLGWGLRGIWAGLAFSLATVAGLLLLRVRWTYRRGGFRVRLG